MGMGIEIRGLGDVSAVLGSGKGGISEYFFDCLRRGVMMIILKINRMERLFTNSKDDENSRMQTRGMGKVPK